jgi:cytochrome P450
VGVGVTLEELDTDPHPALARLRARAPACWVPAVGGWLVTGYAAATGVLLDAATFTVDDPRFTTARVTGPSMLSLDGERHARHRAAFARAFRPADARAWLGDFIGAEAVRLAAGIRPRGQAELRTAFAGPLAAAVMAQALGLAPTGVTPGTVLAWYRDIVAAVAGLPAGEPAHPAAVTGAATVPPATVPPTAEPPTAEPPAPVPPTTVPPTAEPPATVPPTTVPPATVPVASFAELAAAVRAAMASGRAPLLSDAAEAGGLRADEVTANAAVVLFGGIETTEGMICNAALDMLRRPGSLGPRGWDRDLLPGLIEESLRFEPAAAVVDRYATRDVALAGASVRAGDLVRVSLAGANRDPEVFADPDRFDPRRPEAARHLAFARGPHFCIGAHLARLEAVTALAALLDGLPGLRLDPARPAQVRGLVFRKPDALRVRWD